MGNTPPKQMADVEHEGTRILLPIIDGKPMDYDDAIASIFQKKQNEERTVAIHQEISCSPLDGAVAFARALAEKYGWVNAVPTPGFFGDEPPTLIGVPISDTETMQVVWGRVVVPGIDGYFETGLSVKPTPGFIIAGEVKRKHEPQVQEIVALTKKFLAEQSIYKGAAVRVSFAWEREVGPKGYDPIQHSPKFMTLNPAIEHSLIFGEKVQHALNIGLFTPIEYQEACRKHGVPLKRGVLLYGPYGTGKTLTANVTALRATKKGWTFIYLDDVRDLKRGLEFAARYAPAVLFSEDIDRVVTGERSPEMDAILNTLDGIDTKNGEIITVFTTNHVELINPAILRMGRLDAIIEVLPPDAKAAAKLVELYARGLLAKDVDLEEVGRRLAGKIPAFIRETTERAKIAAIANNLGEDIEGRVSSDDILEAADSMEIHNALYMPKDGAKVKNPRMLIEVPQNHPYAEDMLGKYGVANGAAA